MCTILKNLHFKCNIQLYNTNISEKTYIFGICNFPPPLLQTHTNIYPQNLLRAFIVEDTQLSLCLLSAVYIYKLRSTSDRCLSVHSLKTWETHPGLWTVAVLSSGSACVTPKNHFSQQGEVRLRLNYAAEREELEISLHCRKSLNTLYPGAKPVHSGGGIFIELINSVG